MTTPPPLAQFTAEELAAAQSLINQIREATKRKPHAKKIKVPKQAVRVRR